MDKIKEIIETGKAQGTREKTQILNLFSRQYFNSPVPALNLKNTTTNPIRQLSHSQTTSKIQKPILTVHKVQPENNHRSESPESGKSLSHLSEFVKYKPNKLNKIINKSEEPFTIDI